MKNFGKRKKNILTRASCCLRLHCSRALSLSLSLCGTVNTFQSRDIDNLRLSMYDFLGTAAGRAPRRRRIPVEAGGASSATNALGGTPASRDETLAAARAERERRARLKAETGASVRIQVRIGFWR